MSTEAKAFIAEFHNITGNTVKEKHTNLFKLLHRNIHLKNQQETLNHIAANLHPTNHLEKIFRTDFLIYFHRFNELYEDFKTGDDITLRKVSKQDWFFRTAFKISPDTFVNQLLPTLSYSLKVKVLKKIPIDEKSADEIFDMLCNRYGVFFSTVFLPKCTSHKIHETLKTYPIKFTVSQLKLIHKKEPNLICVYFEEMTERLGSSNFMNNHPVLEYVAQKSSEVFSNLFNKYKFEISLGHRTTKNFLKSQKPQVINKPTPYFNILNPAATIRKLGSEIKHVLFETSKDWSSIIKHYPKNHRFDIFKSVYDSTHYRKFGEDISVITGDMMALIKDPKEREKIARLKIEKTNDVSHLMYVTPESCLKEFTEKLNYLSNNERANYVNLTIECCKLDNDLNVLLKICEMVCVRFKNSDSKIRETFFMALNKSKILDKLTQKHWKYIIQIIATAKANGEWIYNEVLFLFKYAQFLEENNQKFDQLIVRNPEWVHYFFGIDTPVSPKGYKKILTALIESGNPKPNPEYEDDAQEFDCNLADLCNVYNNKNPTDIIQVWEHPRILQSIKHLLSKKTSPYYQLKNGIEYIVCQQTSNDEINQLKKMYFQDFSNFGQTSGLMWFLKHEPKTLQENFEHVLSSLINTPIITKRTCRYIKKYSFLNLDAQAVEFCLFQLKEGSRDLFSIKRLVQALSLLATPGTYIDFLKTHLPTSPKVDITDDDRTDLYLLQGYFVQKLRYVNNPEKMLPVTLEFCKGDYLKYALSPLYTSIYNLPENQTKPFISKLEKSKAVSVKKHALHLHCVVSDVDTVYNCLKNATVPAQMITFKYFVKNPTNVFWELVAKQICLTEKNDLQVFKWMIHITVPVSYKSKYFETVWRVLDKYKDNGTKRIYMIKINKQCIRDFTPEFAYTLIKGLFKFDEATNCAANILIYLKNEDKFKFFKEVLRDFRKVYWDCKNTQRESRRKLFAFIQTLFNNYIEAEETDQKFVTELTTCFTSVFALSEAFNENIMISCMSLKGESVEKCAKFMLELNQRLEKDYGNFAVNFFGDIVKTHVLTKLFEKNGDVLKVCDFLLKNQTSVNDYLLIIKLLPTNEPEHPEQYLLYENILKELDKVNDDAVQLQLSFYY